MTIQTSPTYARQKATDGANPVPSRKRGRSRLRMIGCALLSSALLSGCTASSGENFFESVAREIREDRQEVRDVRQDQREDRVAERRDDRRETWRDRRDERPAMGSNLAMRTPLRGRDNAATGEDESLIPPTGLEAPEASASTLSPQETGAGATTAQTLLPQDQPVAATASLAASPLSLIDPAAPATQPQSAEQLSASDALLANGATGGSGLVLEENFNDGTLMAALPPSPRLSHNNSGDGETAGFALGLEGSPPVDPLEQAAQARIPFLHASIDHATCDGGWGPKPKTVNHKRITPGDPYYIEIRMRHTPLLPVGHTYVAYGRLGPNGEPVDEHLIMLAPVGGYAGAALASGIPMPGVLTPHRDDCRIRPEAAYRVSLSAVKYERLLREVQEAKQEQPRYLLFTNNCNHFMSRIASSVGLQPPRNIYVPALQYIYDMMEANENREFARR